MKKFMLAAACALLFATNGIAQEPAPVADAQPATQEVTPVAESGSVVAGTVVANSGCCGTTTPCCDNSRVRRYPVRSALGQRRARRRGCCN